MRFVVSRTSRVGHSSDTPPIPAAQRGTYLRTDQRTTPTLEEAGRRLNLGWSNEEGTNHRETAHGIAREVESEGWIIELSSLDELLAIVRAHGDVILGDVGPETMFLEIYDDYRE